MLYENIDADGYAYVFFVTNAYAAQLASEQSLPEGQAPVISWGKYTGYVLGEPDYAVILRYRVPADTWQGSPANATCWLTSEDNQPVTKEQLGDWFPEMYGDTMDNFFSGNIWPVYSDQDWPGLSQ